MIVFKGAKRESVLLNKEFQGRCFIGSSANGWMNEDLTLEYVKYVIGSFAFGKRFIAWDSFGCHMLESVKKALKSVNVPTAIIPGGCTKHIQAPHVSWNKPFKSYITEKYDQWLAEGIHEFTVAGNIKAAPRITVVLWILDS